MEFSRCSFPPAQRTFMGLKVYFVKFNKFKHKFPWKCKQLSSWNIEWGEGSKHGQDVGGLFFGNQPCFNGLSFLGYVKNIVEHFHKVIFFPYHFRATLEGGKKKFNLHFKTPKMSKQVLRTKKHINA